MLIWNEVCESPHGGMEIVLTLLSRGWWFDPRRRQPEKFLSGCKFMDSHKPPFPWHSQVEQTFFCTNLIEKLQLVKIFVIRTSPIIDLFLF